MKNFPFVSSAEFPSGTGTQIWRGAYHAGKMRATGRCAPPRAPRPRTWASAAEMGMMPAISSPRPRSIESRPSPLASSANPR